MSLIHRLIEAAFVRIAGVVFMAVGGIIWILTLCGIQVPFFEGDSTLAFVVGFALFLGTGTSKKAAKR